MARPTAMKGVKKIQRKSAIPSGMELPFLFGAGNQSGMDRPKPFNVDAKTRRTKTETIPFQKTQTNDNAKAWPSERWLAPITVPAPLRRIHVPAGGLLA